MRFVLCHSCWSWVTSSDARCENCRAAVLLEEPDPQLEALETRLGGNPLRLALVRVERSRLPAVGTLLGTTTGLLFLPYLTQQPSGAVTGVGDAEPRSWFRPTGWTLWGLWQQSAEPAERITAAAPAGDVCGSLAEQFLNSPGAVFYPLESLIRVAIRGGTWTISRTVGRTVQLSVLQPADDWQAAWRQLSASSPSWRHVGAAR